MKKQNKIFLSIFITLVILAGIFALIHRLHTGHEHSSPAEHLTLNKGEKWPADKNTKLHIANLMKILIDFEAKSDIIKLKNYGSLQKQLTSEIEATFESCTMDGQAHEQLHSLLAQLIASIKKLSVQKEAAHAFQNLKNEIQLFDNYFN